ncbi:MAG: glycosyltransferase family 4 protein [Candidatus Hydrogenedentota bacterium]
MVERINVLYLIRTWAIGGSHTIIFLLLRHLPKERFNIICVPYDTPSQTDEALVRALRNRDLPVAEDRVPWQSRTDWWKARNAISELIRKYNVDLIHAHDPQSDVLVGTGRKRWPCAVVCSPYGWWARMFPLRSHVYQWVERTWALPNADQVITVSEDMKRKILRGPTPADRVNVIYTGLDPDALQSGGTREAVREALGIPQDACVVGAVGRMFIEKGHTFLLDAVRGLANAVPSLHVLIVGEGPLRASLERQARNSGLSEQAHFTGFYDDLPGALRAMDIFAQPSILDEGFPTSVLEAQLAGLPVIASDVGGTRETMDVERTGLLVPPRDVAALAEAIRTLAEDPARRKAMSEAGPEWIQKSFTLDTMIRQVSDVYEKALAAYRERSKAG